VVNAPFRTTLIAAPLSRTHCIGVPSIFAGRVRKSVDIASFSLSLSELKLLSFSGFDAVELFGGCQHCCILATSGTSSDAAYSSFPADSVGQTASLDSALYFVVRLDTFVDLWVAALQVLDLAWVDTMEFGVVPDYTRLQQS